MVLLIPDENMKYRFAPNPEKIIHQCNWQHSSPPRPVTINFNQLNKGKIITLLCQVLLISVKSNINLEQAINYESAE